MDAFNASIELLHQTLTGLRDRDVTMWASRESLQALVAATGAAPVVPAVEMKPAPAGSAGVQVESAPSAKAASPAAFPAPAAPPRIAEAPAPASPAPILPFAAPVLPFAGKAAAPAAPAAAGGLSKAAQLEAMRGPVLACVKCPALVKARTQVVFGVGNPEAQLMFVGEAPGEDEDRRGEPFVGRAGQLLTKIIETMGFPRSDVYIANVLKCRPDMPSGSSGNRKPTPGEMGTCLPYLEKQIAIIQPRVLVALGGTAMQGLTGDPAPVMNRLRGKWHEFRGIPLMATFHPSYLLRNQSLGEKRKVWEDMLLVLEKLGRPISEKQRGFFLQK